MTKVLVGLFVAAIIALAVVGLLLKNKIEKVASLESTVSTQAQSLKEAKDLANRVEESLKLREEALAVYRVQINELRKHKAKLERQNEEYANWAKQRLPQSVIDFLREATHSKVRKDLSTRGIVGSAEGSGVQWPSE